ncbi:MAG: alpha/beta hydrolase [Acidobacteria bacterium]|nr:alpha/beta hydrolase [Acidobacteriota bacterium]MCA1637811.1 alpha/beta hydrolase [Acidobacteriota bacterium]
MNGENKIKFDYAQIGGVKLHYAAAGDGERLVILLHGFPEFWYSWRHQLVALSDEYTVIAPDMRGYNLSDKPINIADYDINKLVDDITGLINYFRRENAAIVGHDWGAAVAWAIAQNHPEYVWKLAALQVPPISVWRKNQSFKQFLASWYMFFLQIPKLPEWLMTRSNFAMLENALKNTTAEKDVFKPEDIERYKESWSEPFALTAMINYYRANVFTRLFSKSESQEKIRVPTLFIYGEKDHAILPETVKGVGEAVDAPFEQFHIPDAGHWVQQEASETVTEILRDFLAE